MSKLLTVGHSNHQISYFIDLLKKYDIQYLIDVRSHPYSRYTPHFSREQLLLSCKSNGIKYTYFGDTLGGRPKNPDHYDDSGRALYYKMAQEASYKHSCKRILKGVKNYTIALMCSEENPIFCHRRLLICRSIIDSEVEVLHIRGNGELQPETEISKKTPLKPLQESIFFKEDLEWKSTQSVLRNPQQKDFFLE